MTAVAARPTAPVVCHKCGRQFVLPCDAIAELVEADRRPACGRRVCERRHLARRAAEERTARAARKPARPTQFDIVLLAVAGLERPEAAAWQSAVVVGAWQADRAAFGLPGYEQHYPHSNRVIVCLVRLVSRGLLTRPAIGTYRLTPAGKARVDLLTQPEAA